MEFGMIVQMLLLRILYEFVHKFYAVFECCGEILVQRRMGYVYLWTLQDNSCRIQATEKGQIIQNQSREFDTLV